MRILPPTQCQRVTGRARRGIPLVIIHDWLVDHLDGGDDHEVCSGEGGDKDDHKKVMMRTEIKRMSCGQCPHITGKSGNFCVDDNSDVYLPYCCLSSPLEVGRTGSL